MPVFPTAARSFVMNVTYSCPDCQRAVRADFDASVQSLECPHCGRSVPADGSKVDGERVRGCLLCPSSELYVRKDFSQRLGLSIIIGGFIASSITWYYHQGLATFGILLATAVLDAALYIVTPNSLRCYRCESEYRGLDGLDDHQSFDLEVHERHRQQAARLREAETS